MSANRYPRAIAYIESIGIDPKTIAHDGITVNGYDAFDVDENGRRRMNGSIQGKYRRDWPTPLVGGIVLWLMRQDRKGKRL